MSLSKWSSSCEYRFVKLVLFFVLTAEGLTNEPSWHLEAAPRSAWVLLQSSISVNCLNLTSKFTVFASDIRWFKIANGGIIKLLPTSLDTRVRSNGHQLQIFRAKVDDEGLYCCIPIRNVTLSNCNELTIANLSISQPPVIVAPVKHRIAKVGDTVLLQCYITFVGKPAALEYSWKRFGKDLNLQSSVSKYTTKNFTDLFILIIHDVTETDEGLYNCFLTNANYQKANESIYLQVSKVQNGISM